MAGPRWCCEGPTTFGAQPQQTQQLSKLSDEVLREPGDEPYMGLVSTATDCSSECPINCACSLLCVCDSDECHTCGTFGPYFVNDPPPGHPLYAKPLVYGWDNSSVQVSVVVLENDR